MQEGTDFFAKECDLKDCGSVDVLLTPLSETFQTMTSYVHSTDKKQASQSSVSRQVIRLVRKPSFLRRQESSEKRLPSGFPLSREGRFWSSRTSLIESRVLWDAYILEQWKSWRSLRRCFRDRSLTILATNKGIQSRNGGQSDQSLFPFVRIFSIMSAGTTQFRGILYESP